jgi:hypothetical protein
MHTNSFAPWAGAKVVREFAYDIKMVSGMHKYTCQMWRLIVTTDGGRVITKSDGSVWDGYDPHLNEDARAFLAWAERQL